MVPARGKAAAVVSIAAGVGAILASLMFDEELWKHWQYYPVMWTAAGAAGYLEPRNAWRWPFLMAATLTGISLLYGGPLFIMYAALVLGLPIAFPGLVAAYLGVILSPSRPRRSDREGGRVPN